MAQAFSYYSYNYNFKPSGWYMHGPKYEPDGVLRSLRERAAAISAENLEFFPETEQIVEYFKKNNSVKIIGEPIKLSKNIFDTLLDLDQLG